MPSSGSSWWLQAFANGRPARSTGAARSTRYCGTTRPATPPVLSARSVISPSRSTSRGVPLDPLAGGALPRWAFHASEKNRASPRAGRLPGVGARLGRDRRPALPALGAGRDELALQPAGGVVAGELGLEVGGAGLQLVDLGVEAGVRVAETLHLGLVDVGASAELGETGGVLVALLEPLGHLAPQLRDEFGERHIDVAPLSHTGGGRLCDGPVVRGQQATPGQAGHRDGVRRGAVSAKPSYRGWCGACQPLMPRMTRGRTSSSEIDARSFWTAAAAASSPAGSSGSGFGTPR
jgi:hypothetical protein